MARTGLSSAAKKSTSSLISKVGNLLSSSKKQPSVLGSSSTAKNYTPAPKLNYTPAPKTTTKAPATSGTPAKAPSPAPRATTTSTSSFDSLRNRDAERSNELESNTDKLFKEEQKRIADAEKASKAQRDALVGEYTTASQALIDRLSALESPETAYGRFAGEEGLAEATGVTKGLREQIDRVNKLLKGTEESVNARSMNSGLTEAQRQRLVASEADPYREQLAELSTGLGSATANEQTVRQSIQDRLAAFASGQEQSLEPLRQALSSVGTKINFELPSIADTLSRKITGYTAERETKLTNLLTRLQRGQDLDDAEMAEASSLAREERGYTQSQASLMETLKAAGGANSTATGGTPPTGVSTAGQVTTLTPEQENAIAESLAKSAGL